MYKFTNRLRFRPRAGRSEDAVLDSDSPPSVQLNGGWVTTPTSGRVHGDTKSWDDAHLISPYLYSRVSEVTVWAGQFVNGIQCTFEVYNEKQRTWQTIKGRKLHGDHHGPSKKTVKLARDEHIVAVYGRFGAWVDHLRITTSKGNTHIFGGAGGVNEFNLPIPEKHRLMAFTGGVGGHLHNLGCTYAPSYPETWQPNNHHVYPPRFRAAIKVLVMARQCNSEDMPRHPESPLHLLPPELFDVLVQLLAADPECWLV